MKNKSPQISLYGTHYIRTMKTDTCCPELHWMFLNDDLHWRSKDFSTGGGGGQSEGAKRGIGRFVKKFMYLNGIFGTIMSWVGYGLCV